MSPVDPVFCSRVALSVGFLSGVSNTLFQAYVPKRYLCNPDSRELGWNVGDALTYFAAGTVIGTIATGPYLLIVQVCPDCDFMFALSLCLQPDTCSVRPCDMSSHVLRAKFRVQVDKM